MGVEGGPSGAIAVAGPSIVNEGPVRGSLGFGPRFESVSYSPIDASIGKGDLENMASYKVGMFNPTGEIIFNPRIEAEVGPESRVNEPNLDAVGAISEPQPEPITESSVVAEAKHWLGIAEPAGLQQAEPVLWPILPLQEEQATLVDTQPGSAHNKANVYPRTYPGRVITSTMESPAGAQVEALHVPIPQDQLVEEIVQEKQIKPGEEMDEEDRTREEEEVEELKLKYVEDEPVAAQRRYELREAIRKARVEAEADGVDQIEGWRIKKFFAPEHPGNRSGIAEPEVSDGSLVETYQDVSSGSYGSLEEADKRADNVIEEKKPVRKAKEGKKVREEDVARVRRDPFLKRHPVEEVVARIIKKRIVAEKSGKTVVVQTVEPESTEPRIEDNPYLAEIFSQKAA